MYQLKSTLRNLKRNKTNLIINLLGLTLGMVSTMMIIAYVLSELKVGKEFTNASSIYHVEMKTIQGHFPTSPYPLGGYLRDNLATVEDASVIKNYGAAGYDFRVKVSEKEYILKNLLSADTSFFNIFSYSAISGDPKKALEKPDNIVLTQSEAKRLFGDNNPIGKTLIFEGETALTVGAVIKDIPAGHLNYFRSVINIDSSAPQPFGRFKNWSAYAYTCFLETAPGANIEDIAKYIETTYKEQDSGFYNNFKPKIILIAYNKLYFSEIPQSNTFRKGNFKFVMAFIAVAFIVLVIAIINYINLTNAQGLSRAKGIGVRKVIGSSRFGLIRSFILESLLLYIGAFSFATVLIFSVLKTVSINELVPVSTLLLSFPFITTMLFVFIIAGIFAGFLPGVHLSGISLIKLRRGERIGMRGQNLSRMGLISFQFVIAIVLVISVFTVNKQMNYMLHKDIGFKGDNLVHFQFKSDKHDVFRDKLSRQTSINNVTYSDFSTGTKSVRRIGAGLNIDGVSTNVKFAQFSSDKHFTETMGVKLIAGRNFLENEDAYLINETAAILWNIEDLNIKPTLRDVNIVGIINDFNIESLHSTIEPTAILHQNGKKCVVKISSSNPTEIASALQHIKSTWKEVEKSLPPDIVFMDESINYMYKKEAHFQIVLNIFSGLAIFISIMGLFGISLYLITARIKEIGIRKVNGAKVSEILTMLNKHFVKWVAIAFIIACPIAYYFMNKWLQNFAYKTTLSWWAFALAGVLALVIAILTVSWQSWRAATRNPVEALRYE